MCDKIVLLAKTNLNTINVLVVNALIGSNIYRNKVSTKMFQ